MRSPKVLCVFLCLIVIVVVIQFTGLSKMLISQHTLEGKQQILVGQHSKTNSRDCVSQIKLVESLKKEVQNLKDKLKERDQENQQLHKLLKAMSMSGDTVWSDMEDANASPGYESHNLGGKSKPARTKTRSGLNKLPIWSFDEKHLYEASPSASRPKYSMNGKQVKNIAALLALARKTACNYMMKHKNSTSCSLVHGNFKFDVIKGLEFVFILKILKAKLFKVSVMQKLNPRVQIQYHDVPAKQKKISIVTILSDDVPLSRVYGFTSMLKNLQIEHSKVFVVFVLFTKKSKREIYAKAIQDINKGKKHFQIKISYQQGKFERALARHIGVSKVPGDGLILFLDIDISLASGFIEKCQLYTEKGKSVYFPIVFSMYNPAMIAKKGRKKQFTISDNHGLWRMVGYGNVCLYKSDYLGIGGYNTSIKGWGWEDSDLYQRFSSSNTIAVIRAPDPGIFHRWHKKVCSNATIADNSQYDACISSSFAYEASLKQLASKLISYKEKEASVLL